MKWLASAGLAFCGLLFSQVSEAYNSACWKVDPEFLLVANIRQGLRNPFYGRPQNQRLPDPMFEQQVAQIRAEQANACGAYVRRAVYQDPASLSVLNEFGCIGSRPADPYAVQERYLSIECDCKYTLRTFIGTDAACEADDPRPLALRKPTTKDPDRPPGETPPPTNPPAAPPADTPPPLPAISLCDDPAVIAGDHARWVRRPNGSNACVLSCGAAGGPGAYGVEPGESCRPGHHTVEAYEAFVCCSPN